MLLVWGGDVVGQGWGINPDFGGMKIFEAMRAHETRLLHSFRRHDLCGRPRPGRSQLDDGRIWRNLVDAGKSRRSPRRSTSFAAITATTCSTRICGDSTPKFQFLRSGTITRYATTGIRARSSMTPRYTVKERRLARWPRPGGRFSIICRCATIRAIRNASTAASTTVRRSKFSCSMSAAIAGRTPPTGRLR